MNSDNNKYDNLDKFFQSLLKNENLKRENWNTPPDSVLHNALSELDNKNNKRGWFYVLIGGLSLIFIIISFVLIKSVDRINELENSISNLMLENTKLNQYHSETNTSIIQDINNSNLNEELGLGTMDSKKEIGTTFSIEKNILKKKTNDNSSISIFGERHGQKIIDADTIYTRENPILSNIDNNLDEANSLNNNDEPKSYLKQNTDIIDLLENKEFLISANNRGLFDKLDQKISDLVIPTIERKNNSFKYHIPLKLYGGIGISGNTIKMTSEDKNYSFLTGYEKYYTSYYINTGIIYPLTKRFYSDLNINYNNIFINSEYNNGYLYQKSNESIDISGNRIYADDIDLYSILGKQNDEIKFEYINYNIQDQDILLNNTKIANHFNTLGINLMGFYKVINKRKLSFSSGVGTGYNFILNLNEYMKMNLYHKDILMLSKEGSSTSGSLANNFWTIGGSLRLEYNLSSKFGFFWNIDIFHPISNLNNLPDNNITFSRLHYIKTGLNLYYKF